MGKAKSKGKPAQHHQQGGGGFCSKKQFNTTAFNTAAASVHSCSENAEAVKDGKKT
jgi:hypothetical protein